MNLRMPRKTTNIIQVYQRRERERENIAQQNNMIIKKM